MTAENDDFSTDDRVPPDKHEIERLKRRKRSNDDTRTRFDGGMSDSNAGDTEAGVTLNPSAAGYGKPLPHQRFMADKLVFGTCEQPFGGEDWPQKSGYEILAEILRSTAAAINRVSDE